MIIILFTNIGLNLATNRNAYLPIIFDMIQLLLLCYFAYNLDNYDKAKIAILLVVLLLVVAAVSYIFILSSIMPLSFGPIITKMIYLIPAVSVALTYIARYNKKGFKQLSK